MVKLKNIAHWFVDFIEVYLPIAFFVMLFIVFLVNIFFRYILHSSQNWTFEFSINSIVVISLLGSCTAYRTGDHVAFDLIYNRINEKSKNIFRIISYLLIVIFFSVAIPESIRYLIKLPAVTPIMKIPQKIIFLSFPTFLVSTVFRSAYYLVMDIKAFKNKTYIQLYGNNKNREVL